MIAIDLESSVLSDLPVDTDSKPKCETSTQNDTLSDQSLSGFSSENKSSQAINCEKTVSFGSVQVREFNRTVGDHPEVKDGPPLSIDWDFLDRNPLQLDEFELQAKRKGLNKLSGGARRMLLKIIFQVPEQEFLRAGGLPKKSSFRKRMKKTLSLKYIGTLFGMKSFDTKITTS